MREPQTRLVLLFLLAFVPVTNAAAQPAPDTAPLEALKKEVSTGSLGEGLLTAFEKYALGEIRSANVLRDDLATWIDTNPVARQTSAWVWSRIPDPTIFSRLNRIWKNDPDGLQRRPQLAFGIAAAWRHGSLDHPAREWDSWTSGRSAIPTIEQSFDWYLRNERALRFPIKSATWIELAFTGLNDVPLEERDWVLERYKGVKTPRLRDAYAEVPYISGGLDGKPPTLQNMVNHGGVCTVNTQYGMSVMRTLGFPSTFGGGPGHCWPCWIEPDGRKLRFARRNELGNRDGKLGQWITNELQYESDLSRLAKALSISADRLRKADCAAAAAHIATTAGATQLLVEAIDANELSATTWLEFARQLRVGDAEGKPARVLFKRLPRALSGNLDFAVRCLREMNSDPAEPGGPSGSEQYAPDWLRCCDSLIKKARSAERTDLIGNLQAMRATVMERSVTPEVAFKAYRKLALDAASGGDASALQTALDGALVLTRRSGSQPDQLRLLRMVASKTKDRDCRRLAEEQLWTLQYELGETAEADRIRLAALAREEELQSEALTRELALTVACGGGGGDRFVDHRDDAAKFIGVRYSSGEWNGIPVVASVRPLYRDDEGSVVEGRLHGSVRGEEFEVVAPKGLEVAGLSTSSGNMVDGFALVFAPVRRGKAVLKEARFSDWCGGSDRGEVLLGGRGKRVVGLHGRAGDLLDALGLVVVRN